MRDGRAEGSSATGDGGRAATSLMPDIAHVLVPYCVQFYVPSCKNDPVTSRW